MVDVSYVTYPMGPSLTGHLDRACHNYHAGLRFDFTENGKYIEIHYGTVRNRVTEYNNKDLRSGRAGKYYVTKIDTHEYSRVRSDIYERFDHSTYKLGRNDCWSVVEWFANDRGIDKKNLDGPIGCRKGFGNGVRKSGLSKALSRLS